MLGNRGRLLELDGWRGFAALGVLLFHLNTRSPLFWLWSLVDLFMVLSGFLITRILLEAHAAGRFSYFTFWARRAHRLWPVYFAAVAFTLLLYVAGGRSDEFLDGRGYQLFQVLTFSQFLELNVIPNSGLGWSNDFLPGLAHTWSLAAEEQFYLLWPLVLGLSLKLRSFRLAGLACVAAIVVATTARLSGLNDFVLLTRLDGLAFGAALALVHARGALSTEAAHARRRALWWAVGIGGLLALHYIYKNFPGPANFTQNATVVPGFALLFFGVVGLTLEYRGHRALAVLRSPVALWLGSVSYALYMVHFPVTWLVAFPYFDGKWAQNLVGISLSLALAQAAKLFIEAPLLRFKPRFLGERPATATLADSVGVVPEPAN